MDLLFGSHVMNDSDLPFTQRLKLRENVMSWICRDFGLYNFFFPTASPSASSTATPATADWTEKQKISHVQNILSNYLQQNEQSLTKILVNENASALRRSISKLRVDPVVTYRDVARASLLLDNYWDDIKVTLTDAKWAMCLLKFDTAQVTLRLLYIWYYMQSVAESSSDVRASVYLSLVDSLFCTVASDDVSYDKYSTNFKKLLKAWYSELMVGMYDVDDEECTDENIDTFLTQKLDAIDTHNSKIRAADFVDAFMRTVDADNSWVLTANHLVNLWDNKMISKRTGKKRISNSNSVSNDITNVVSGKDMDELFKENGIMDEDTDEDDDEDDDVNIKGANTSRRLAGSSMDDRKRKRRMKDEDFDPESVDDDDEDVDDDDEDSGDRYYTRTPQVERRTIKKKKASPVPKGRKTNLSSRKKSSKKVQQPTRASGRTNGLATRYVHQVKRSPQPVPSGRSSRLRQTHRPAKPDYADYDDDDDMDAYDDMNDEGVARHPAYIGRTKLEQVHEQVHEQDNIFEEEDDEQFMQSPDVNINGSSMRRARSSQHTAGASSNYRRSNSAQVPPENGHDDEDEDDDYEEHGNASQDDAEGDDDDDEYNDGGMSSRYRSTSRTHAAAGSRSSKRLLKSPRQASYV